VLVSCYIENYSYYIDLEYLYYGVILDNYTVNRIRVSIVWFSIHTYTEMPYTIGNHIILTYVKYNITVQYYTEIPLTTPSPPEFVSWSSGY
jgi:hypothetical protein